jgi:hypothetical protein
MLMSKFLQSILMDKAGEESAGGGAEESAEEESEEGSEEADEEGEEDEESGEEDENEGLSVEQLKEARNLYKLLSDKSTQTETLRILAKEAGILDKDGQPPATKKEEKAAIKNTVQILENALGKELAWLAPKLAAAIDEIRGQDQESTKKDIDSLKQSQVAKEVDNAYETLARETKGLSRKFEGKMVGLADKLYPAPGMSTIEYVRHLYTIASATDSGKSNKQRLAEKINRNAKDVPGRLTESTATGGNKGIDKSSRASLKDAVRQAAAKMGYTGS